MTDDLFPSLPESLSARERWVRQNGVTVGLTEGSIESVLGSHRATGLQERAFGASRGDALAALATKLWESKDLPTWEML